MKTKLTIREMTAHEKNHYSCLTVIGGVNETRIDQINQRFIFKTGVDVDNFQLIGVYNISSSNNKAIVYVITNHSNKDIKGDDAFFMIEIEHAFDDIIQWSGESISYSGDIIVMVYNDNPLTFSEEDLRNLQNHIDRLPPNRTSSDVCDYQHNKAYKDKKKQPKEACGGVIVGV